MRRNLLLAALALLAGMVGGTAAPMAKADFTGHYEPADAKSEQSFSLDVTQTGTKADLSFSAANNDGSGAAPDGDGKGDLDSSGILKFKFTDSFGNAGNATLSATKGGYRLQMNCDHGGRAARASLLWRRDAQEDGQQAVALITGRRGARGRPGPACRRRPCGTTRWPWRCPAAGRRLPFHTHSRGWRRHGDRFGRRLFWNRSTALVRSLSTPSPLA